MDMAVAEKTFEKYVSCDPEILGGEPVLRGTRLRLETVLECFEEGATAEQVFEWYPGVGLEILQQIKAGFRPGMAVSHH